MGRSIPNRIYTALQNVLVSDLPSLHREAEQILGVRREHPRCERTLGED